MIFIIKNQSTNSKTTNFINYQLFLIMNIEGYQENSEIGPDQNKYQKKESVGLLNLESDPVPSALCPDTPCFKQKNMLSANSESTPEHLRDFSENGTPPFWREANDEDMLPGFPWKRRAAPSDMDDKLSAISDHSFVQAKQHGCFNNKSMNITQEHIQYQMPGSSKQSSFIAEEAPGNDGVDYDEIEQLVFMLDEIEINLKSYLATSGKECEVPREEQSRRDQTDTSSSVLANSSQCLLTPFGQDNRIYGANAISSDNNPIITHCGHTVQRVIGVARHMHSELKKQKMFLEKLKGNFERQLGGMRDKLRRYMQDGRNDNVNSIHFQKKIQELQSDLINKEKKLKQYSSQIVDLKQSKRSLQEALCSVNQSQRNKRDLNDLNQNDATYQLNPSLFNLADNSAQLEELQHKIDELKQQNGSLQAKNQELQDEVYCNNQRTESYESELKELKTDLYEKNTHFEKKHKLTEQLKKDIAKLQTELKSLNKASKNLIEDNEKFYQTNIKYSLKIKTQKSLIKELQAEINLYNEQNATSRKMNQDDFLDDSCKLGNDQIDDCQIQVNGSHNNNVFNEITDPICPQQDNSLKLFEMQQENINEFDNNESQDLGQFELRDQHLGETTGQDMPFAPCTQDFDENFQDLDDININLRENNQQEYNNRSQENTPWDAVLEGPGEREEIDGARDLQEGMVLKEENQLGHQDASITQDESIELIHLNNSSDKDHDHQNTKKSLQLNLVEPATEFDTPRRQGNSIQSQNSSDEEALQGFQARFSTNQEVKKPVVPRLVGLDLGTFNSCKYPCNTMDYNENQEAKKYEIDEEIQKQDVRCSHPLKLTGLEKLIIPETTKNQRSFMLKTPMRPSGEKSLSSKNLGNLTLKLRDGLKIPKIRHQSPMNNNNQEKFGLISATQEYRLYDTSLKIQEDTKVPQKKLSNFMLDQMGTRSILSLTAQRSAKKQVNDPKRPSLQIKSQFFKLKESITSVPTFDQNDNQQIHIKTPQPQLSNLQSPWKPRQQILTPLKLAEINFSSKKQMDDELEKENTQVGDLLKEKELLENLLKAYSSIVGKATGEGGGPMRLNSKQINYGKSRLQKLRVGYSKKNGYQVQFLDQDDEQQLFALEYVTAILNQPKFAMEKLSKNFFKDAKKLYEKAKQQNCCFSKFPEFIDHHIQRSLYDRDLEFDLLIREQPMLPKRHQSLYLPNKNNSNEDSDDFSLSNGTSESISSSSSSQLFCKNSVNSKLDDPKSPKKSERKHKSQVIQHKPLAKNCQEPNKLISFFQNLKETKDKIFDDEEQNCSKTQESIKSKTPNQTNDSNFLDLDRTIKKIYSQIKRNSLVKDIKIRRNTDVRIFESSKDKEINAKSNQQNMLKSLKQDASLTPDSLKYPLANPTHKKPDPYNINSPNQPRISDPVSTQRPHYHGKGLRHLASQKTNPNFLQMQINLRSMELKKVKAAVERGPVDYASGDKVLGEKQAAERAAKRKSGAQLKN